MQIIIVGCGKVGTALTAQLCNEQHNITVIDSDSAVVNAISTTYDVLGIIHPRSIKKIKMDGHPVEHEVIRSTNVFFIAYMVIFAASLLLLCINEVDFTTNFTAVAATLNNIGPGMGLVGPTHNFGIYRGLPKYVLMADMLIGRLEIFPMLVLLSYRNWKR